MPQIRRSCTGTCQRKVRFTKFGHAKYDGLCRRCFKAKTGQRRPIAGRIKKERTFVAKKPAATQQKGKK